MKTKSLILGLTALTYLILTSVKVHKLTEEHKNRLQLSIQNIKKKVVSTMQSKESWRNTIMDSHNASFSCLSDSGCLGKNRAIRVLRNSHGDVLYDAGLENEGGFTLDGEYCRGYSIAKDCVIRIEMDWDFVCSGQGLPLAYPEIKMRGKWQVASTKKMSPSTEEYDFETSLKSKDAKYFQWRKETSPPENALKSYFR